MSDIIHRSCYIRRLVKSVLLVACLFISDSIAAQNLVKNGDFEKNIKRYLLCSWYEDYIYFNGAMIDWEVLQGTPDIITDKVDPSCMMYTFPNTNSKTQTGEQIPHSGNTMIGISTRFFPSYNGREVVENTLTEPMIPGQKYRVSLYVSLADYCTVATNNLNVYFTTKKVPYLNYRVTDLGILPQVEFKQMVEDDQNWTLLDTIITATDSWQYITIGNFRNDATTVVKPHASDHTERFNGAYYFIDDVSVEPLCKLKPDLGNTTALYPGQNLMLDAGSAGSKYKWQDGSSDRFFEVTKEGIYWVEVSDSVCSVTDSIEIVNINIEMPNVFTPNNDNVNDYFTPIVMKGVAEAQLSVYNRWGKKVCQTDDLIKGWSGDDCVPGIYYWEVRYTDWNNKESVIKGEVTLLK